ncbi:MAG: D-2-hydroxyacid dehydrogenase [Muribaculaceae bacterium]|nr:D-2-hydroxyacid dehydrogenase [Muribaculaceae bacterium]
MACSAILWFPKAWVVIIFADKILKKIVVLDAFVANSGDLSWDALHALGNVEIYERTSESQLAERCLGAYAIFTNKVVLSGDLLRSLPDLKFIGVLATGYNNIDIKAAAEMGVTVCNVPNYSTYSVSQLVFAHLLNIVNGVGLYSESVKEGAWCKCADFSYRLSNISEIHGLTMAVYGLGHIGSEVAKIADVFGMKVISFTSKSQEQLPAYIEKVSKEDMFRRADVLSLNAPLSADNIKFINADTLSMMKSSAILINTARGGLVDEDALTEALNSGKIAAAALDVLSSEPPLATNPLLKAKNCYITPHIAWQSSHARADLLRISIDNLQAFMAGEPQNVVH